MPSAYWRDDADAIGTASIAGEAFHFESDSLEAGRRKVVQRFPGSDFVRGQDVGPGERTLDISGYLIGGDYHLKRDRMIAVFEDPADKVLIHPYYGQITVTVEGKLKIAQTKDRLGRCAFSFRCIKVPPTTSQSSATPNLGDLSALGASVLQSTATPAMASQLTQLSTAAPNAALISNVSKLQTALKSAYTAAQSAITIATDIAGQIDSLASDVAFAIESPLAIMERIGGVVGLVVGAPMQFANAGRNVVNVLTDGERVAAMLGIADFLRSPEGPALPALSARALADAPPDDVTQEESALRVGYAISAMVRIGVISTMVQSLAKRLPESSDQAREAQAEILAAIAGIGNGDPDSLLYAVSDELREQLLDVRASMTRYLSDVATKLPELRTYTVPAETDAFDLAFELLGDASRWEELVERNALQNPALITAGTVIEYIEAA